MHTIPEMSGPYVRKEKSVTRTMTLVMLALVPFNWQVHDTHFVVAHMHYVLVGGMFFPLIAGLYYWLPLFSGRMPSETLGKWGFWLTFLGTGLACWVCRGGSTLMKRAWAGIFSTCCHP